MFLDDLKVAAGATMKQINIAMMEQVIEQYPQEFDELIADTFYKMVNGVNEKAGVYILHTIGTILENYASYRGRDKAPEAYEQRKKVLLGYLMKGLVHFKESISIEALNIIGHELFGSEKLSLDEKCAYFSYIAKHLMSAVGEQSKATLAFYNRASALSYLYRFITAYEFAYGRFEIPQIPKVAFFPGTFDPFSSGHKGIVEAVRKSAD